MLILCTVFIKSSHYELETVCTVRWDQQEVSLLTPCSVLSLFIVHPHVGGHAECPAAQGGVNNTWTVVSLSPICSTSIGETVDSGETQGIWQEHLKTFSKAKSPQV
jgi:hypothetical protein